MSSTRAKLLRELYRRLYKFYGPQKWWPAKTPLEMAVGAILTQNTAWKNVERAIANLKKAGLLKSASRIDETNEKRLARIIKPAGYYNVKSRRLKNFAAFLSLKYGGKLSMLRRLDTVAMRTELLSVNGIGPETCDSILLYAFDRPVFVVDSYTKRLLTRHHIVRGGEAYDDVQKIFMDGLPADFKLFNEYHALIVRLCKDFCKARPRCDSCPLQGLDQNILKLTGKNNIM